MSWPLFIPSKGRPDSALLQTLYSSWVVVEPQDRLLYEKKIGKGRLIVLPANDLGIAYVRQFILDQCRENKTPWYWMIDDDVSKFYETKNQRLVEIDPMLALTQAEQLIKKQPNVGQAALEYAQFSWSQTKPVKLIGYCDVVVAINTSLTRLASYRANMNLKEDRDFTLQILASGARTMRCSQLSFKAPKNGSNKGGLSEVYAERGREERAVERMCEAWPGVVSKQVKSDGRIDCKINWAFFK